MAESQLRLAAQSFATEAPRDGVVSVPGFNFGGLVMAFDQARVEQGIVDENATSGTR